MILAISNGVPLVVRQASTLVHDHQNGIVIQELTEVFSACQFFLQTLRRWNNSLIVNSQLIDEFSAERLIQRWKEVMTLGKAQ
jgi:accessory secretory protein Asp1